MKIRIQAESDAGCVRDHNEDMALVGEARLRDGRLAVETDLTATPGFPLAVADGMGGRAAGELASEMVIDALADFVGELPSGLTIDELSGRISGWAVNTNRVVVIRGNASGNAGMGSTLSGVLAYEGKLILFNAGDSRIYRLRDNVLRQLSTDHSMRELTRNPGYPSNVMYNCFGLEGDFFIDVKDITDKIMADDRLLICSDGLNDMLTDEEIEEAGPEVSRLTEAAKNAGGKDNITLIIAHFNE